MELMIHPTSRTNQPPFRVHDVKDYKFITTYTVEVEFNDGNKEIFYSIDSVEVIESTPKFKPNSQWYYINSKGFIEDFIVHSGLSPKSAEVLSKVHTLYSDWNEAYKALEEYNKIFTTFKE